MSLMQVLVVKPFGKIVNSIMPTAFVISFTEAAAFGISSLVIA